MGRVPFSLCLLGILVASATLNVACGGSSAEANIEDDDAGAGGSAASGATSTGGVSSGGSATAGSNTAGNATGGSATAGSNTGGSATGGSAGTNAGAGGFYAGAAGVGGAGGTGGGRCNPGAEVCACGSSILYCRPVGEVPLEQGAPLPAPGTCPPAESVRTTNFCGPVAWQWSVSVAPVPELPNCSPSTTCCYEMASSNCTNVGGMGGMSGYASR